MILNFKMSFRRNDYPSWEFPEVIAAVYIFMCLMSLLININVLALVVKSKRMLGSPKYWLVVSSSVLFIFQSTVPNNVLVVGWLWSGGNIGIIWKTVIVFNRYAVVGIISWASFTINLDYLICMKSAAFTRYYRRKAIPLVMILTWGPMLAAVATISVLNDTSDSNTALILDTFSHEILIWVTLFAPLALSILCGVIVMIWRCSDKLQAVIVANEDVSDPVDIGMCPFLPPADHIMFILTLILMYIPAAILSYDPMWPDDDPQIMKFWITCTTLRDNACGVSPIAWFLFRDIRLTCRKCCSRICKIQPESLVETSEMNIYDSYPYCSRIHI